MIVTKDNTSIKCKVTEITDSEIKYKKENSDILFSSSKVNISTVIMGNGEVITFENKSDSLRSEHLKFKGVEIKGKLKDIITNLELKGFEYIGIDGGSVGMQGKFFNEDVKLLFSEKYGNVSQIIVVFLRKYNYWGSLINDFEKISFVLEKKYKIEPSKKIRKFYYPFEEGDGHELTAIKINKASILKVYDILNGEIDIMIGDECNIVMFYKDKLGAQLEEKIESENAFEDL